MRRSECEVNLHERIEAGNMSVVRPTFSSLFIGRTSASLVATNFGRRAQLASASRLSCSTPLSRVQIPPSVTSLSIRASIQHAQQQVYIASCARQRATGIDSRNEPLNWQRRAWLLQIAFAGDCDEASENEPARPQSQRPSGPGKAYRSSPRRAWLRVAVRMPS
jgi:hypothetical protein